RDHARVLDAHEVAGAGRRARPAGRVLRRVAPCDQQEPELPHRASLNLGLDPGELGSSDRGRSPAERAVKFVAGTTIRAKSSSTTWMRWIAALAICLLAANARAQDWG